MGRSAFLLLSLLLSVGLGKPGAYAQKKTTDNNIQALSQQFRTATSDKEKADLLESITDYFFAQKNADSLLQYHKYAIDVYQHLHHAEKLAKHQLVVARIYADMGDMANAELYLQSAWAFFKDKKDIERYARARYIEGAILQYKQQFEPASERFVEIINLYHQGENDIQDNTIYTAYLGAFSSYTFSRNFDKALKITDRYFSFIKGKFPAEIGSAHLLLGNLYNYTSNYVKAAGEFNKAKAFYGKLNNDAAIASINLQLGMAYGSLKKLDSAILVLNQARTYFANNNYKGEESLTLYALSGMALEQKKYTEANELLKRAIKVNTSTSTLSDYYIAQQNNINLNMVMEDTAGISSKPEKKAALSREIKAYEAIFAKIAAQKTGLVSPQFQIESYELLSRAYELLPNYQAAYNNYRLGVQLKDSMFGADKMRDMNTIEAEIDLERERSKIQLEEATKRLQLQKAMALEALQRDYERKQAAAKTEEERQKLMQEEALKRKEIEIRYVAEQKAVALKFTQEKEIARKEQEKKDALAAAELQSERNLRNLSAIGVVLATLLLAVIGRFYYQKRKDNKRIELERQKSEELLLNILPQEVADELKEKGKTSAQQYPEVSVLFTDFVNFTQISEKLGVEDLVNELNINFTAFDNIMERNGLEKIKTIGDAYLAVSGLPVANPRHAQNAVNAARDIIEFVEKRKKEVPYGLDIRIGINSGALIAGIIGVKKFAYDIWGDTVNIAARMEQSGVPGKVNISESTYLLVKDHFECTHRGKISAKGKGEIDMYFVDGIIK